jgi:hypothetical protein
MGDSGDSLDPFFWLEFFGFDRLFVGRILGKPSCLRSLPKAAENSACAASV